MSHQVQVGDSISLLPCTEQGESKYHVRQSIVKAGNIANCLENWKDLTSDRWILKCVKGITIPFEKTPVQRAQPFPFRLDPVEKKFVEKEINTLLDKAVLKVVKEVHGQWVSNIFLRPKPNGKFRMILDLTELNKCIHYEHFKMFNLRTALDLLEQGMWMASADLTDAYYSVPITKSQRKYLRFRWKTNLYEYQVLPNGLSPGPRIFTKLLKPIYAEMGENGHVCFPYLDDSFVVGKTEKICKKGINSLTGMFNELGFTINEEKSVLQPTQKLTFLGFLIDSVNMEVSLTEDKKEKFVQVANQILQNDSTKIREVAGLVGLMVAYSPAVEYAGVHFKTLERDKIKALKRSKGNFEDYMWLSPGGKSDIKWWLENLENHRKIRRKEPDMELYTDASQQGWGAHTEHQQTGGRWHESELKHINALELKAILFGLMSLCKVTNKHIRIRTDNMTALAYVKNMGGAKSGDCLLEALHIWEWAQQNQCWLSITHIPGVDNVLADLRSRKFRDHLEWELNPKLFKTMCKKWGKPEVDMFASRLNAKLAKYVSWEPEPENWRTDAFSFNWNNMFLYCFPPFSLLPRVARKIRRDGARAIVVAPHWPAQPWHPLLQGEATEVLEFRKDKYNLTGLGNACRTESAEKLCESRLTAYLF